MNFRVEFVRPRSGCLNKQDEGLFRKSKARRNAIMYHMTPLTSLHKTIMIYCQRDYFKNEKTTNTAWWLLVCNIFGLLSDDEACQQNARMTDPGKRGEFLNPREKKIPQKWRIYCVTYRLGSKNSKWIRVMSKLVMAFTSLVSCWRKRKLVDTCNCRDGHMGNCLGFPVKIT